MSHSAIRVAARYQRKKKIQTQSGDEAVVYEYSDRQIAKRHKEKAERIEALRKQMSSLREQARKDLKAKDAATRLTALAVCLMDETYERVGNPKSAEEGHHGVTNWLVKHVSLSKGKATISYVGKSGVKQKKEVTNSRVLDALKKALEGKEGKEKILCEGEDCDILAKDVNAYLAPFDVTAKDIRGLHANEEMRRQLKEIRGGALPEDPKKRKEVLDKEFKKALDLAAKAVGHEPATLRSQYLVPGLEESYLKDGTVPDTLDKAARVASLYLATKSQGQREDEGAEALVHRKPKIKPPRNDLRKHRDTSDPDVDRDPDAEQDQKDRSHNWKDIGASMVAAWERKAKPRKVRKVREVGSTWKVDNTWSAKKMQDGKPTVQSGFTSQDAAKAWVAGTDSKAKPKEEVKPDPSPEDLDKTKKQEEAEAKAALGEATALTTKVLEGRGMGALPDPYRTRLKGYLNRLAPGMTKAFLKSLAAEMDALPKDHPEGKEAIVAGDAALKVDFSKMPPEEAAKAFAQAIFAEQVTFNPLMLGGVAVSDKTTPMTGDQKVEAEKQRKERSVQALKIYSQMDASHRELAVLRCKEELKDLDPESPRAREISGIMDGVVMAAILKGEETKGVQISKRTATLAQTLSRVGKEDLLLGTVSDLKSPQGQKAVRTALGSMSDMELTDFVGSGALTPFTELLTARKNIKGPDGEVIKGGGDYRLLDQERQAVRKRIEDAVVEDIALMDDLVGDYLEANGVENTQDARDKYLQEKRKESIETKHPKLAEELLGEGNGEANANRMSTEELIAMLEAEAAEQRNHVMDSLGKDFENAPTTESAAIAKAVQEEGNTNALSQKRVQRHPGDVWETDAGFWTLLTDGSKQGPFESKEDLTSAGSNKVAGWDFTPWVFLKST